MRRTPVKVNAKPSPFVRTVLLGWFALTIGALLVLRTLKIDLGQGSFAYHYSEFQGARLLRALWLLPVAGLIVLAMLRPRIGAWIGLMAVMLMGVWTFCAPLQAMEQHSFNMRSPSQDGAFVNELYTITSLRDYLRGFDQRIQRSPAELRGTRVISNPPGTTILFYLVPIVWPPNPQSPGWIERFLQRHYDVHDDGLVTTMLTVQIAGLLVALWCAAAIVLYRVARIFLPPAGAMLCVLIAWFNPSSTHFTPGKDPMQLLTVGLMMWTWFVAVRSGRPLVGALFGAIAIVSTTIGLIHVWIAAALIITSAWECDSIKRFALRNLLSAAAGGFATAIAIYLLTDWNLAKTLFLVWRRFAQLQRELALSHVIWFLIGLPIFLLFVSPALALFASLFIRNRRTLNFGARLAIVTMAMMLLSYVVGVTYELPRLWVVFLPLLTLGLMSAAPLSHVRHEGRAMRAAIVIAVVHIAFTAAHWSLLDARESEHRLTGESPEYFGKT